MTEIRIKMSLFLILGLQITEVTGQYSSSVFVRDGDDVTMSCEYVFDGQDECDSTYWILSGSRITHLVKQGKIVKDADPKSDRLSLTQNCSLVLKKVTAGDTDHYNCRQSRSGQYDLNTLVYLSVVTMTEQKDGDEVKFTCSVSPHVYFTHTVKWLHERQKVDEGNTDIKTSQSKSSATVTFPSSYLKKPKYHEMFQCEVTDGYEGKELLTFSAPSSGEDRTTSVQTTTENRKNSRMEPAAPDHSDTSPRQPDWWLYVAVAGGSAALLVIIVALIIWKRAKGRKPQKDGDTENAEQGQGLNSTETQSAPGSSQDTADPDDGVSYASISYTKKTDSRAQVRVRDDDDDDEGDAVTYSTVKVSSSSAGASTDPSDVYANVNKTDG
ncbi:uncharacterized protein LOC130187677 isoform X2 [Seriola aureovittata]|uniref:uncharacterized protein LOC130187677 isoform X2 n=1 Tax=Seriola aureovittata TaxID=2871759 RepID=UPI0024BDD60F|nr:uncharacterized protein LOC130187677 isoform X2 [Seriola aureovittata]